MSSIFQKPPNNYQYQIGVPNYVDYNTTPQAVVGAGVQSVGNLVWPANVFVQEGQRLVARWSGTVAGVVNNRSFATRIDSVTIMSVLFNTTEMPGGANAGFYYETELTRIGTNLEMITWSSALEDNSIAAGAATVYKCGRSTIPFSSINPEVAHLLQIDINPTGAGDTITFRIGHLYIF